MHPPGMFMTSRCVAFPKSEVFVVQFLLAEKSSSWLARHSRFTIVLAMLFWGASFPAMKFSISQMDPYFVVFCRMVLGSICLLPLVPHAPRFQYKKGDIWWLLALVLFEPCLYFFFEIRALELTTATQAGFIASTLPLMVILGSSLLLKEKIRARSIVGMLVAFAGMTLLTLTSEKNTAAPNPLLGNTFELLAMGSATGFTLILKHLADRYHPILLTFFQTIAGALFYLFAVFSEHPFKTLFENPTTLGIILFLGIVVTVLAYIFYISGIQRIPANEAILFVNLIPIFGMLLSMFFLGESIHLIQGAACVLVILGVLVGQKRQPVIDHNAA